MKGYEKGEQYNYKTNCKNENTNTGKSGINQVASEDQGITCKETLCDSKLIFDKSEWLTTKEAAIYLRKLTPLGTPSANAVHKLVAKGTIRRRKFSGRLYFNKKELGFLIASSPS